MDFVWKPGQVKFAIEIKGYGPHVQNTDRTRYRQELNRETYLQIAGYRVIAVPYDDLESAPEQTISLLKALLTPCLLKTSSEGSGQFFEDRARHIADGEPDEWDDSAGGCGEANGHQSEDSDKTPNYSR
ncbi:RAP domain-containing protein [Paenibacillus rhizoplanae]